MKATPKVVTPKKAAPASTTAPSAGGKKVDLPAATTNSEIEPEVNF